MIDQTPAKSVAGQPLPASSSVATPELERIERHLDEGKYPDARALATALHEDVATRGRGAYLLARIAQGEECYAEALEHIEEAYSLDQYDASTIAKYIDLLFWVDNYRKALTLYSDLPTDLQADPQILAELSWIYFGMGLHAHARSISARVSGRTDSAMHTTRLRRFLATLLRRTTDRVLLKIEEREVSEMMLDTPLGAALDTLPSQNLAQCYRLRASMDSAIIEMARMQERWNYVRPRFQIGFALLTVAATVVVALKLPGATDPIWVAASLVTIGGVVVVPAAWLFIRARTYLGATILASLVGGPALLAGLGILRLDAGKTDPLRLVATALLFGAAVAAATAVAQFSTLAYFAFRRRSLNSRHARAWTIGALSRIRVDLQSVDNRYDPSKRREWLNYLDVAAELADGTLANQIALADGTAMTWLSVWTRGIAGSFRYMKRLIISPSGDSWEHLDRLLNRQVKAFATENWGAALRRESPPLPKRSRGERVRTALRITISAAVLGLVYIVAAPIVGTSSDLLERGAIVSLVWGLLSLLFSLDPASRDKLGAIRELSDTWGLAPARKSEQAADEKAVVRVRTL